MMMGPTSKNKSNYIVDTLFIVDNGVAQSFGHCAHSTYCICVQWNRSHLEWATPQPPMHLVVLQGIYHPTTIPDLEPAGDSDTCMGRQVPAIPRNPLLYLHSVES